MFKFTTRTVTALALCILATVIAPTYALPTSTSDLSSVPVHDATQLDHDRNLIARSDCPAKVENTPWILSNIAVINTTHPNGLGSSICFNLFDTNKGLQISTVCELTRTAETMKLNPDGYFPCINQTASFSVDWETLGEIKISRRYQDDCLGKPPYDHGTFFGGGKFDFTEPIDTVDGQYMTQRRLEINITSQD